MTIKNRDFFLKYFTAVYSCFFYAHYSLVNSNFSLTNLPFIFFGTVFSYKLLQTSTINWYLLTLSAIASLLLSIETMIQYSLIAFITLIYPKYLRPNYILKPISIAISWCLLFKSTEFTVYLESLFLILALSLPFDLRDKNEDDDITTLINIMHIRNFKYVCIMLWSAYGFFKISNNFDFYTVISFIILSFYYTFSLSIIKVESSKLKTYVLLDLTIALQFFLAYLK